MSRSGDGEKALGFFGIALICFVLACLIAFIQWLGKGNNLNWASIVLGWLVLGGYLFVARKRRATGQWQEPAYFLAVPPIVIGLLVSTVLTAYDVLNTPLYVLMLMASIAGIVYWIFRGPRFRFPWGIPNLIGWSLLTLILLGLVSLIGLPLEAKHHEDKSNSYLASASKMIDKERFDASRRELDRAEEEDPDNPRIDLIEKRLRNGENQANLEKEISSAIRTKDYRDALNLASTGDPSFRREQQERIVKKIVNGSKYQLYGTNSRKQLAKMIDDLRIATSFGSAFTYTLEARAEVVLSEAEDELRQLDNPAPTSSSGSTGPGYSGGGDFDLPSVDVPLVPGT